MEALGLGSFYEPFESEIRGRNGTLFLFTGLKAQTVQNLKSFEGVDIVWVEEAQNVSKRSWDVLTPTIRKELSEIWITFNPDLDSDETYVRFVQKAPQDAHVEHLTYRDNPWFPAVLENERRAFLERDPLGYENIWEGRCRAAVDGAIYSREIGQLIEDGRLRAVPYDPMLAVDTVWDLGWNDKMSVLQVQRLGSEIRIIGYLEEQFITLTEMVQTLNGFNYRYGTDFLPHDGRAKDYKTGRSAEEILVQLHRRPVIVPNMALEMGIKVVRSVFPRLYIDEERCMRLVECCKRYRRTIPATTNEPAAPLHDEFSHGADALRYLAIIAEQVGGATAMRKQPIKYPKINRA